MRFHTHLKEALTKEKIQIILGGDAETYSTHAVCICMWWTNLILFVPGALNTFKGQEIKKKYTLSIKSLCNILTS